MIGQFSGPYSKTRKNLKLVCCQNVSYDVNYCQVFIIFMADKSSKISFTTCFPLKNDFKLTRFAFDVLQKFEAVPSEQKSFPNPSDTLEKYNKSVSYSVAPSSWF